MAAVRDLGTVRSIIRGVDEQAPHALLFEIIDNAEHSLSTKVFIDINTHERRVTFGFENSANEDDLNKLVQFNPSSAIHNTSSISTCGQGSKYYGYRFRGKQTHASIRIDEHTNTPIYTVSYVNSGTIFDSATSPDISESEFSDILAKNTSFAKTQDEIVGSIEKIFSNKDQYYPFNPKTIIVSKDITNDKLIDWLQSDENIADLEKHLINKYYNEIKNKELTLYIKFPNKKEFIEIGRNSITDIIGSTTMKKEHVIDIYYVLDTIEYTKKSKDTSKKIVDGLKKGDYIIKIRNIFFRIQKNGSSSTRHSINICDTNLEKILHIFKFTQYNIPDNSNLKNCIVGNSLEEYCGVYIKIGEKFIDGKPISCALTKRNLEGAKYYRGILELQNPKETKMMLGISGLKSNFDLTRMGDLNEIVKQSAHVYKNFCKELAKDDSLTFLTINPELYTVVQTSNEKSIKKSKPGIMYLRCVGNNFWKLGITYDGNKSNRIFDPITPNEINTLKKSFPEETIYDSNKQYYVFLSYSFNKCASTEQKLKEYLMELQDVLMYDSRCGDDVREYFHCDDLNIIENVRNFIMNEVS